MTTFAYGSGYPDGRMTIEDHLQEAEMALGRAMHGSNDAQRMEALSRCAETHQRMAEFKAARAREQELKEALHLPSAEPQFPDQP